MFPPYPKLWSGTNQEDHTVDGGWRRVCRHLPDDAKRTYLDGNWRVRVIKYLSPASCAIYWSLQGSNFHLVSVWKPIKYEVEDHPLALCDPYSIDASVDLVAADRVGSSYIGEIYYLKYRASQRWYWLSRQKPDELAIFVSFDSCCGIKPKCESSYLEVWDLYSMLRFNLAVPHASFQNSLMSSYTRPRQSIELRMIIITPKKD